MVNIFFKVDPMVYADIRCCSPFHKRLCRVYRLLTVLPHYARNFALDLLYYSPGQGIDLTNGECIQCAGEQSCRDTLARDWRFRHDDFERTRPMGSPLPTDRLTVHDLRWYEGIADDAEAKRFGGCLTAEWRLDLITTIAMAAAWCWGLSSTQARNQRHDRHRGYAIVLRQLDLLAPSLTELAKLLAVNAVLTAAAVAAVYLAVFENPEQYPEDV